MKLPSWLAASVVGGIFAIVVYAVSAEETDSPAPSVSDTADDSKSEDTTTEGTTKEVDSVSPDGKFAFLMGRGEDQRTIDLIDKKNREGPSIHR